MSEHELLSCAAQADDELLGMVYSVNPLTSDASLLSADAVPSAPPTESTAQSEAPRLVRSWRQKRPAPVYGQSQQQWVSLVNSSVVRTNQPWTEDEVQRMNNFIMESEKRPRWIDVAAHVGTKTPQQCYKRYMRYDVCPTHVEGRWTAEEDERLKRAVERHGRHWREVSEFMGTRTPTQCVHRWDLRHRIRPRHRQPWTKDEDELLLRYVKTYGCVWPTSVAIEGVAHDMIACQRRYSVLVRRAAVVPVAAQRTANA